MGAGLSGNKSPFKPRKDSADKSRSGNRRFPDPSIVRDQGPFEFFGGIKKPHMKNLIRIYIMSHGVLQNPDSLKNFQHKRPIGQAT
jgi:hypothetical protein